MSELSPEEKAFLQSATSAWEPSSAKARAIRAGITARLGDAGDFGSDAPAPPGPARGMGAKVAMRGPWALGAGLAIVGLCAVAGLWVRTSDSPPPPVVTRELPTVVTAPSPSTQPSVAPSMATISIDALPSVTTALPSSPNRRTPSPPAAVDAAGGLAEELALLRQAQASFRDGSPRDALATLSLHATRFPQGTLRGERMTLQALALCQEGQVEAARAIRSELERLSPGSNHLQRLAHSCAAP